MINQAKRNSVTLPLILGLLGAIIVGQNKDTPKALVGGVLGGLLGVVINWRRSIEDDSSTHYSQPSTKPTTNTSYPRSGGSTTIQTAVQLIKLNYSARGIPVNVTGTYNRINIDLQAPDLVDSFGRYREIIMLPTRYSSSQVAEAKRAFEEAKRGVDELRPRTPADIAFFRKAQVNQISLSIGGMHITVINL